MRLLLPLVVLLVACGPTVSTWDPLSIEPRLPTFPAAVDQNDPISVYQYGASLLERAPLDAAAAFHLASRLDPTWADPLYARRIALLMSNPRILSEYIRGTRRVVLSPGVQRVDSLHRDALMLNPFLHQRYDVLAIRRVMIWEIEREIRREDPSAIINTVALESHITSLLSRSPASVQAWVTHSEGRFSVAQGHYRRALSDAREKAYLYADLGRVLVLMGRFSEAHEELGNALEEFRATDQEDLVRTYESKALYEHSIGLILEQLRDPAGAREAYGRALQEDLSYYPSHLRLGELALEAGDTLTALSEFELAVQIRDSDPGIRQKYADLLFRAGRYGEAESEARYAIELEPLFAPSYLSLAESVNAQGRSDDALRHYRSFLDRAPRGSSERSYVSDRIRELSGGSR